MTRVPLADKIRREVDEEADVILGEMARLMSPALRTRAEQVAEVARVLKFPIPAPIAWMLDLQDVQTADPKARDYPPGSEGYLMRVADERGITVDEARRELLEQLRALAEYDQLRGRAAREAEAAAAAAEAIDVPVVRKPDPPAEPVAEGPEAPKPAPTVKPPATTVTVKPRTGPSVRPPLDVEHVTVRPRSELGRGPAKPAAATKKPAKDGSRTVTHPGPEALPEHLRGMPSASGNISISTRIKATTGQRQVYDDVAAHPGTLGPEIAERTGLTTGAVGNYSRDLQKAGLIRQNGIERLKHGVTSGRAGKELEIVPGALEGGPRPTSPPSGAGGGDVTAPAPASSGKSPTVESPPSGSSSPGAESGERQTGGVDRAANEAAATAGSDLSGAELLKLHRDYAVSMKGKGSFTATQAADALGVAVIASELMFSLLAESARGAIVIDVGVPGLKAYEYNEMPTGKAGMGAAAQRDHATTKALGASNGSVSDPVARTGKSFVSQFSGVPEVQRLVRMAEQKWPGSVSKRGSEHIMIKVPNHQPITIGANSKGNALRKDQTRLERAGLVGAVR